VRHVFGNVGAEVEPEVVFDSSDTGEIFRLFEYSITWQNLGKSKTQGVTRTPIGPPASQ